ncbi:MAG TPA: hypothetical protein VET87_01170 [Rubrivivax sp.]|nr:hypothetical protein [Rubrivivax sp.]
MGSPSLLYWLVVALIALALWYSLRSHKPEGATTCGASRAKPINIQAKILSDDRFSVQVVGGNRYRKSFRRLQQRHGIDGIDAAYCCEAVLGLEDENPYDDQAVAVTIEGLKVGYLSRQTARVFRGELRRGGIADHRQFAVDARIHWGGDDEIFGVKLDIWWASTGEREERAPASERTRSFATPDLADWIAASSFQRRAK